MERKIYASIHTHSMDLFDSHNDPDELCARMKELGGEGLILTQHGVLTCVELMRQSCEKYGLKFVPGIEAYYKYADEKNRKHLILIATDDIGYHELSKAVTESNNDDGFAVMNDEILGKYFGRGTAGHGHVIATSACVAGPLAQILDANSNIRKSIEKLKNKQSKSGLDPNDKAYIYKLLRQKELSKELNKLKIEKDSLQKIAETKFKKRENAISKMEGAEKENALKELAADKGKAEEAKAKLEIKKDEIKKTNKALSAVNRDVKTMTERVNTFISLKNAIFTNESNLEDDSVLYESAKEEALRLEGIFGKGNFYIEIQNHGLEIEEFVYPKLADIAKESGIPLVASNDVHLVNRTEEEVLRRQILHSKRFGEKFEEGGDDRYEYYLKTDAELKEALLKILPEDAVNEGISNIKVIFDRCNVEFPTGQHYPKFPVAEGETTLEVFHREIERGIKWRFPNGLPSGYQERLDKEMDIIESMGYVDYHLVVKDFLEYGRLLSCVPYDRLEDAPLEIERLKTWIKANGWSGGFSIGPGRGSAVGSLVCYILGITSLDPIKYDLLFERFLNPERVSMPDIDSDISNNVRPYVIKYVQNKYGADAVCNIITFSKEAPKGAIRAASKFYSLKEYDDAKKLLSLGDQIARKVPAEPNTAFDTRLGNGQTVYESLREQFSDDNDALEILRWAKTIEGTLKAYGVHAAGVVISDNSDIKEYIPLRKTKLKRNGNAQRILTTQCEMTTVEEKGLLKMDFLGLKTLDIITDALRLIKERTGKEIDILTDIPMDEEVIYEEIFAKGRTNSVFQFESNEMKSMLKRFHPTKFEDIIILVSMFRPGPMQFIDGVIDVKRGKDPDYITPELEPILSKTYGAIVYQEQVMEIFQNLAGYTLGGADQVRRYMSKKKADKLAHERNVFIAGCGKNGIDADKANALFDQMNEFAKYAFNKSHAAAYAANAYYTAWLKYHYPAEFITAAMNWAEIKKIPGLMKEAKNFGVKVLPPDINRSGTGFEVTENGDIIFGLGSIKSVGNAGAEIIAERKANGIYYSLVDFFMRTNINSAAVKSLIAAGAFDCFCDNRKAMDGVVDAYKDITKRIKGKKQFKADAEKLLPLLPNIKTADDFNLTLSENNLKKTDFPKLTDVSRLTMRIANAQKRISVLECELAETVIPTYMTETLEERMIGEKEFLGNYVTAHPLDEYPKAEEVGATSVDDVTKGTKMIQGIISDVSIKNRKKDNAEMAFFELEDATGIIKVDCFTKAYEQYKELIEDGNVLLLKGNILEDEDEYVFSVSEASIASKTKKTFVKTVSSYARFHLEEEDRFRKRYELKTGNRFLIFDKAMNKFREAEYLVDDSVKNLKDIAIL